MHCVGDGESGGREAAVGEGDFKPSASALSTRVRARLARFTLSSHDARRRHSSAEPRQRHDDDRLASSHVRPVIDVEVLCLRRRCRCCAARAAEDGGPVVQSSEPRRRRQTEFSADIDPGERRRQLCWWSGDDTDDVRQSGTGLYGGRSHRANADHRISFLLSGRSPTARRHVTHDADDSVMTLLVTS